MSKPRKITLVVLAIIVLALAGAGTAALTNKDSNKTEQTNKAAPKNDQNNKDSSMNSMIDQLKGKTGDEYDEAFINLMSEHHAGAVAMAKMVDNEAKHPELRSMAGEIIAAQNKEIDDMKSWAATWGYEYKELRQANIDAMTANLKGKSGDELDRQFIIDMIGHHTQAIEMTNLSAEDAKHTEIKKLSEDIYMMQAEEIGKMQDWAKAWSYDIGSSGPSMQGHQM